MKLPFYLKIQQKEFYKTLERVHASQKDTMKKIISKNYPELKSSWKDEFAMFWIGFLKGEYKSINQYLNRKMVK